MKKNINLPYILIIVIYSFVGVLIFADNIMAENIRIKLILKTDKEIYQVGDEIFLTYNFINNNTEPIHLLPWGGEYAINWISAFDSTGRSLISIPILFLNIKFIPLCEDYILIKPKSEYTINLKGKIVDEKLSKFNRESSKKYKGVFLDFEDSAIYMGSTGFFSLQASYKGKIEWTEIGKANCGLSDIFVGELESNKVKIKIIRK